MRPMLRLAAAVLALGLAACQTPPRTASLTGQPSRVTSAQQPTLPASQADFLATIARHHQNMIDASVALFPRVRSPAWKRYLSDTIKVQADELRQVRALQEQAGNGDGREFALPPFPDPHDGSVAEATASYLQTKASYDERLARQLDKAPSGLSPQVAGLIGKLSARLPDEPARRARIGEEDPSSAPAASQGPRRAGSPKHGSARKHQAGGKKSQVRPPKKGQKAGAARAPAKKKKK